jgi:hypothetical protein
MRSSLMNTAGLQASLPRPIFPGAMRGQALLTAASA